MKTAVKTIILVLTLLFFNIQTGMAQCHIDDWTALKALYESTDGDNWINNTGWEEITAIAPSANCNLELLFRVELDYQGRVEKLKLTINELNGSIPPEFV